MSDTQPPADGPPAQEVPGQPGGPPGSGMPPGASSPPPYPAPGPGPGPASGAYPPPGYGSQPGAYPPPGYGSQPGAYPPLGYAAAGYGPRKTNGFAIASLILAVLWLGGLGSLLGLVFGIVALNKVSKSQGGMDGKGIAIAGTVIGALGVLATAAIVVASVVIVQDLNRHVTVPVGSEVQFRSNLTDGLSSVAVTSVQIVSPSAYVPGPGSGQQYVAADIRACGSSNISSGVVLRSAFSLHSSDGSVAQPAPVDVRTPAINGFATVPSNGCLTGWVTFVTAAGTTPTSVDFSWFILTHVTWTVPAGSTSG